MKIPVKINLPEVKVEQTITEVRAPTDDSIRLLDEMCEKAQKRILARFRAGNTMIDAAVTIMDAPFTDKEAVFITFTINGIVKTYDREVERMATHDERLATIRSLLEEVTRDVLEDIVIRTVKR